MEKLSIFRRELDDLDEQLVQILARRFDVCRQVASYKAQMNIPMMQPARVAEVKERAVKRGSAVGLSPQFAVELYNLIISEACRMEDEIIERTKANEPAKADI